MLRLILVLVILVLFSVPPSSNAQTPIPLPGGCEPAAMLTKLSTFKTAKDPHKDFATLKTLKTALDLEVAKCNGLYFVGRNAKVIGPILLEKGIYKTTLTTKGFFIANFKVVEGSCEVAGIAFYLISQGEATDGAENLITSSGCTALITTENVTAPWTLTLEKIG